MRIKTLPIILPPAMYERLEREARAHERDVVQQARWILKQALRESTMAEQPDADASTTDNGA